MGYFSKLDADEQEKYGDEDEELANTLMDEKGISYEEAVAEVKKIREKQRDSHYDDLDDVSAREPESYGERY